MNAPFEFRMEGGLAHVTHGKFQNALCGAMTKQAAPDRAVPCSRCLEAAAQIEIEYEDGRPATGW